MHIVGFLKTFDFKYIHFRSVMNDDLLLIDYVKSFTLNVLEN